VSRYQDRVLALAGIFQAARLAQQLARAGRADPSAYRASIHSILMIDADSAREVYGGVHGVRLGLALLREKLLGETDPKDVELAKYVIAMIQLEGALRRRAEVAETIRAGAAAAESKMAFFETGASDDDAHPRLIEKLAELYTQTLSTLTPRIVVSGEHGYLSTPLIAAKVRAALFAGVRSAVLWRQLGGSRLQLVFSRSRIGREAARLLSEVGADN